MDKDGVMRTGWVSSGGKKYYMTADGSMRTRPGWMKTGGKLYFLESGGAVHTGWLRRGGKSYFMDKDGVIQTGLKDISGKRYVFDPSGVMLTGWQSYKGKKYYLSDKGAARGVKSINGTQYLFSDDGALMTGVCEYKGKIYENTVKGAVAGVIDPSSLVSLVYSDGAAAAVSREAPFSNSAFTVRIPYDSSDNSQKWEVVKYADGTVRLKNVFSGMYLEGPDNAGRLKVTCQDGLDCTAWTMSASADGSTALTGSSGKGLPAAISLNPARGVDRSDLLYMDADAVFDTVISKISRGSAEKEYVVSCTYKDYSALSSRFASYFDVNTEGARLFTGYSVSRGEATLDLSAGTKMYRQNQAVQNAYKAAEKACGVTAGMSVREKVKKINCYICKNYSGVINGSNMYQMMVKKYGSCVQHSMLFAHLCRHFGVTVEYVSLTSRGGGEGHMLNRVRIGGKWCYCDTMLNNGYGNESRVDETFLFMESLAQNPRNCYAGYDLSNIITVSTGR